MLEDLSFIRAHLVELYRLADGLPSVRHFISMAVAEADDCIAREKGHHARGAPPSPSHRKGNSQGGAV